MPLGAQYCIDGMYYKVGTHGYVFMHVNGGWIRSTLTVGEIHARDRSNYPEVGY